MNGGDRCDDVGSRNGVVRRITAFVIDYGVFFVPWVALLAVVGANLSSLGVDPFDGPPWRRHAVGFATLTVPAVLYFALFESSASGATPGKRVVGICIRSVDKSRATFVRAALRNLAKFLPWEIFHGLLWRWPGWPSDPTPMTTFQFVWIIAGWSLAVVSVGPLIVHGQPLYDRLTGLRVVATNRTTA